jgi:hypothetical protein
MYKNKSTLKVLIYKAYALNDKYTYSIRNNLNKINSYGKQVDKRHKKKY